MFHLYQSNKIEALLAQLVKLLLQQETSPLKSQTVVVENPGLAHWLKMQLANSLGIAANIEFPMPSRFFWQIQRSIQPDLDEESVFSKDTLTWLILECLETSELLNQPSFELLNTYLNDHDSNPVSDQQQALKRYQLATTIADLYDQYLVFRPDWIEAWQQNNFQMDSEPLGDQVWQAQLWLEILKLAEQKQLSTQHRATMLNDFMQALKQGENKQALPSDVILFGFSALPKHQVETLSVLSNNMDVHLLTPNPSMHYWGDVIDETVQAKLRMKHKSVELADAGNDLLASLGTMGKDFQRMLLEIERIEEQPMFFDSQDKSVLCVIQNQILNLQQAKDSQTIIEPTDKSLQIVGCHSATREVEVLHDHLLNIFSTTTMEPQDIVVMIPDVASYAPYIDAVFNSSGFHIPYSISDRPVQAEHPLIAAFIALLELPNGRLTFSDVMSLLEVPSVYRAYGINEAHLPKLKSWVIDAGVRWGFDGEQRQKQGLPSWEQNTWLYGFKRLLMGYAVNSHELVNGISPIKNIEGLDASLLGPLIQFVNGLHDFMLETEQPLSAHKWSEYLHRILNVSFDVNDAEQPVVEHIYQAIENWVSSIQRVSYEAPLPFSVLADGLKQGLQRQTGSQHFMVGKVNFCTLLPMRSIPFKVVAVLGLNDQDYPRSVTPNSLDLMRFKRRIGDRSRRDEDRYLFLEAILSARESLWLSYKSRDQKEDKPLTPSVVLAELLDYLQEGFVCDDGAQPLKKLFTQHPLQPFNESYYLSNSPLFSFNKDWLAAHDSELASKELTGENVLPKRESFEQSEILLDDLVTFYQNPSKFYLNKQLNASLSIWAESQEDDEPFDLDALTLFKMKQDLLDSAMTDMANHGECSVRAQHQTSVAGKLAYGEIGEKQWQSLQVAIAPLLQQCESHMLEKNKQPLEINLPFYSLFSDTDKIAEAVPKETLSILKANTQTPISVLGWVSHTYQEQLVHVVPSKLKAKHVIKLLLEHSMLSAMGHQFHARLVCQDAVLTIAPKAKVQAMEYIKPLLEQFLLAQLHPLPLLPETAWQSIRPANHGAKKEYSHSKASNETFYGTIGDFGKPAEREDLHVERCLGALSNIPQQTFSMAQTLYSDWLDSMEVKPHD